MHMVHRLVSVIAAVISALAATAEPPARVVFMDCGAADDSGLPVCEAVADEARLASYSKWLETDSAGMALALHAAACRASKAPGRSSEAAALHVALVKGGNHADLGFRLRRGDSVEDHPRTPYVRLDPSPRTFGTTLLHETGHVVLTTLTGGEPLPGRAIAALPHSTAALTDRSTALSEGFAIHLETLAAHLGTDAATRAAYRHERFEFGLPAGRGAEYFHHARDLLTFSQTIARYYEVRENNFAFESACREPDYVRVQFEKSRDFATLRSANQLLQSEGFYASFFFALAVAGDGPPTRERVFDRHERMLRWLVEMLASPPTDPDTPFLLEFVKTCLRVSPDEAEEVVDILLDLSHGVFVDPGAEKLWREHYLAALRLDVGNLKMVEIAQARASWRATVLSDPNVLYQRLGPQVRCEVPARTVELVALGPAVPLAFDINTVQEGVLRAVPDLSAAEIERWLAERHRRPFSSPGDLRERVGLSDAAERQLRFAAE